MGGFFSPPSQPAPPPAPTADTAAINDQATQERLRRQKASGRESTILSGNTGSNFDSNAATQKTTLLGG